MSKKIFLVLVIFSTISVIFADAGFIEKLRENPHRYHYLSLEEYLQRDHYNRDFVPTDPPTGTVRQTAEFEQMEGVLVVYPLGIPVSAVAEMSQDTKVYTIVTSGSQNSCINTYTNNGVNLANCEFINASTNTYWVRDYGPWFIAHDDQIELVDFPYNRPRPYDDEIPVVVANYLGIDYYGMNVEHTGGNYMCDGNYIGASTDLVYDENPGLLPSQIDDYFLNYLGIEDYYVTIDPLDDYIKHIDCWGKFLDVDKVLIGQVPETDYRYADFEFVANFFANQTTAWGNNFQVYRVFTPGGNPATPYTNSLILNKKVFLPTTGSQWDNAAIAVYEDAMPGYEIIPVSYYGWYNTDALHCRTRGVADREMLYIHHLPLLDEQDYLDEYSIEAKIIPYSGEPVYDDSLMVYYKIDDGDFIALPLTAAGDDIYTAVMPGQPEGAVISYYIHAADESGKSVDHPFIGQFDPHVFTVVNGPLPAELVVDPIAINIEMLQHEVDEMLLQLSNIGGMPLDFSLQTDADWLSLDPMNGIINGGNSEDITVTFDTNDLEIGEYYGEIIISDDREETIVPVSLNVIGTGSDNDVMALTNNILGNYPNPFNPKTMIRFNLAAPAKVNLTIVNVKGQKIRTLINETRQAGLHQVEWNGRDDNGKIAASGVYFTIMDANSDSSEYTSVKKVILLK